jgi:hypothetical protein
MNTTISLSIAALLSLSCASSQAAVSIVAPTASTNGSVQFPADISFLIISPGFSGIYLILDEYVVSDGTNTFSNPVVNDIMVSINGGSASAAGAIFFDNAADPMDPPLENDGYFYFTGSFPVIPGDILTIKAGTITYGAVGNFNPQATQTFTGNMFLLNGFTGAVMGVPVPELGTATLSLLAAAALLRRRR